MTDTVIRPARQDDLRGMLDLYRHLNPRDPPPDVADATAAWTALLRSGVNTVFVAEMAGALVAACTLSVIPNLTRGAKPYGVIENVVTHADHRRAGLGRLVLTAALNAAWQAQCYKVMLASGRDEETLRFYEKIGFTRGGKTFFEMRRTERA
jgi:GNAT superfamily N-acetyltransferase